MKGQWASQELRDEVVVFVEYWVKKTGISKSQLLKWIGLSTIKWNRWKERIGLPNQHNGQMPKQHWLLDWEKKSIIEFHSSHSHEGYRRNSFMMLDLDVVAVSPTSVYRVLSAAGCLKRWNGQESLKGTGFKQPKSPHSHWHIDVSYININGTFYYLCSILDGFSRYIVHWEIRESMKEIDIETILQRGKEKFPDESTRVISDNGPQFISRDFREYIRISGMTHVRTSPYYPQSNGKIERWHKSLKTECIRPKVPLSLEDARRIVEDYITEYNNERLHSAIGYITPLDKLEGREEEIKRDRKIKLAWARHLREEAHKQKEHNDDQPLIGKKAGVEVESRRSCERSEGISLTQPERKLQSPIEVGYLLMEV